MKVWGDYVVEHDILRRHPNLCAIADCLERGEWLVTGLPEGASIGDSLLCGWHVVEVTLLDKDKNVVNFLKDVDCGPLGAVLIEDER